MIKKIISEAAVMKKIITAANNLTNAQFELQSNKILKKKALSDTKKEIEAFRESIKKSSLTLEERDSLLNKSDEELYKFAHELIIEFIRQEIKTPK